MGSLLRSAAQSPIGCSFGWLGIDLWVAVSANTSRYTVSFWHCHTQNYVSNNSEEIVFLNKYQQTWYYSSLEIKINSAIYFMYVQDP